MILQREVLLQSRQRVQVNVPEWFGQDRVAQRYEEMLSDMGWEEISEIDETQPRRGRLPHPCRAYVGAFVVMTEQKLAGAAALRAFLADHPALVWLLAWRVVPDSGSAYGFDVERSLPTADHLRTKFRTLDEAVLADAHRHTLKAAHQLMPETGETVVIDTKHVYAYVKENNPRAYVHERYNASQQPCGDHDCRLGFKPTHNQSRPGGRQGEWLWGYGSGVAVSPTCDGGSIVLADFTQPFNKADVSYALPLLRRATRQLGFAPVNLTADAAFDAWYVYEWVAKGHGWAAIALNARGAAIIHLSDDGRPLCHDQPMTLVSQWQEKGCPRACFRCLTCRKQRKMNLRPGNLLRWRTDRQSAEYKSRYRQRTCVERVNSQAHALGIDRPFQRSQAAISRRNTLIYIVINLRTIRLYRKRHATRQGLLNAA